MKTSTGWHSTSWSDIAELKYGRALRDYRESSGPVRVFGTNGPVGFTSVRQAAGPGVVIGRKGAYRGVHYSPSDFWVIDTAFYLVPTSEMNMRWAYYALTLADINGLDSGSAIPSTTRESFGSLQVLLPPFWEQQAIAEVLGALDDKIAANTRLAATADELSTTRFSQVRMEHIESNLTYGDVAAVGGGGTPSTKNPNYWGDEVSWATPTDVTGLEGFQLFETERRISEAGLKACASPLYPEGTILMTSRATIGAFAIAAVPLAVNQGFITVQSSGEVPSNWLFYEMRSRVDEYLAWANGATFMELSRGSFRKLSVHVAPPSTMRSFAEYAEGLRSAAAAAHAENRTLAATRDALLPKLMSGQLRVKDAETLAEQVGV